MICIEAAHETWAYIEPHTKVDLILWPGYWGKDRDPVWNESLTGDTLKVFQNNKLWKTNVVQATHFGNHENVGLGEGPFGKSMVINSENELVYFAATSEPEDFQVIFQKNRDSSEIGPYEIRVYTE